MQSTHGSLTKSAGIAAETGKQPHMVRSALYNWPATIEHWPADLHGSANAQFWPANCKVHSLGFQAGTMFQHTSS